MLKRVMLTTLALALAGCGAAPEASKTPEVGPKADAQGHLRYGAITFTPCALEGMGDTSVEAQCARFEVPEDHDQPNGRKISLAVALVPAKGEAEPDPVVMIAGGPGQSALETYPVVDAAFRDVRRHRHVLLVDARGTGGSNLLNCPAMTEALLATTSREEARAVLKRETERCRDTLSKRADLRRYTTTDHIRDLDAVRRAIGVEQFNLVGVSYGTRVAQQFAKRYPAHVRTILLDSVAPNSLVLGQDHARNLDAALTSQYARCAKDPGCRKLAEPSAAARQLRTELRDGTAPEVRYRDPVTGEWRTERATWDHLAMILRMYAYQPASAAMIPRILDRGANGDLTGMMALARMMSGDLGDSIAAGMSLSVSCSEDPELKVDPADADTVLGTEFLEAFGVQCEVWPKGERPADFRAPLTGKVPLLAISGEFDPVTPPRYGDEVVKGLPNARHLVLKGQGHSVIGVGCMPKLFAQFIETADPKALDARCLDRLRPTPPFAGGFGWDP